jgi:hypothetical protein
MIRTFRGNNNNKQTNNKKVKKKKKVFGKGSSFSAVSQITPHPFN